MHSEKNIKYYALKYNAVRIAPVPEIFDSSTKFVYQIFLKPKIFNYRLLTD